jgi:hypothetical protein
MQAIGTEDVDGRPKPGQDAKKAIQSKQIVR